MTDVSNEQEEKATRIADLKRVDEIIKRSTALWIGLLGALVFACVTLAGVKDIAFFNPKMGTQLPFTGVAVPVVYFFYGGSLLIAVVYIYLHIYLEQLWDILGKAPAMVDGRPLSERLHPWLVADFALRWRDRLRNPPMDENSAQHRSLSIVADFAAVLLVWMLTPIVITGFLLRSLPARDLIMTGFITVFLIFAVYTGFNSYDSAKRQLENRIYGDLSKKYFYRRTITFMTLVALSIPFVSLAHPPLGLIFATVNLSGEVMSEKPKDWLGLEFSKAEFKASWCQEKKRNDKANCPSALVLDDDTGIDKALKMTFEQDWARRREALISTFARLNFEGKDLRFGDLSETQLEGVNFNKTRLIGSNFKFSRLEGASFEHARLEDAVFWGSRLESANFKSARASSANFRATRLEDANLTSALFLGANFYGARLDSADLSRANLQNANLSFVRLIGSKAKTLKLDETIFKNTNVYFAAFRKTHIGATQLSELLNYDTTFGDSSVKLPENTLRPCQWTEGELEDQEFLARWKGWRMANEVNIVFGIPDVAAIPPPSYCLPMAYRRDRLPPPSL